MQGQEICRGVVPRLSRGLCLGSLALSLLMIPNNPRFLLWWLFQRIKLSKGLSALAKILFIFTNFLSLPTFYKCGWFVATWQILAEADKSSIASPTKFAPGKNWTKLTRYTKTVINLLIVCRKSYDKSVIELKSVCQIGKNCLLQNSEILKFWND